jgi:hypothetical protein
VSAGSRRRATAELDPDASVRPMLCAAMSRRSVLAAAGLLVGAALAACSTGSTPAASQPAPEPADRPVRVPYLGTTMFLVDDGTTGLLIDAYLTSIPLSAGAAVSLRRGFAL